MGRTVTTTRLIPGPRGGDGAPGVDATPITSSTALTVARVAMLDPADPGKVRNARDFRTRRVLGTTTATQNPGTQQAIQHRGPIDRATKNLGPGLATAVGFTTTGDLVRVTDPTCASGLNLAGWCDEAGTVVDDPRLADTYDIRDYGAIPDDPTSDAALALRTILARMPAIGGRIHVPDGNWYLLSSEPGLPGVHVLVWKNVVIEGASAFSPFNFASRFVKRPGITAFRIYYGANPVFRSVGISGTSKKTTTASVASYTPNVVPAVISVDDASDFLVGETVCIRGAAAPRKLTSTRGSVTSGSPTVTLSGDVFATLPGVRAGDWIKLGSAYPAPTKVLSISVNGLTLTMASNAAATVSGGDVYLCPEMHFRVISKSGNDLTVDNYNPDGNALTNATLEHAAAGIDAMSLFRLESVGIGGYSQNEGVEGAGVLMLGDHTFADVSNTNNSGAAGLYVYGSRHAIFAHGVDSHVCEFVSLKAGQCTSWVVLDFSGYGNTYVGLHIDGGVGILTADIGNRSTFVHPYGEIGTVYYFGNGTTVLGGTLSPGSGGRMMTATVETGFTSGFAGAQHRAALDPRRFFLSLQDVSIPAGQNAYGLEVKGTGEAEGTNDAALFKFRHTGGTDFVASPNVTSATRTAFAIADVGARWRPGTFWLPQGYVTGTAANKTDNPAAAIQVVYGDFAAAPPAFASDRIAADGSVDGTWHVGDEAVNTNVSAGSVDRWRCITAGAFGVAVWKATRVEA